MSHTPSYAPTWQEIAEQEERTDESRTWRVPPWQSLVEQGVAVRRAFKVSPEQWEALYAPGRHARVFGTVTPPPPESYTITNVQHFQFLPAIEAIKKQGVREALVAASMATSPAMMMAAHYMGNAAPSLLSRDEALNVEEAVRAEQSHLLYHKAMWRAHGRRVLVLDPTTYTLLAHSDLPAFPSRMLGAPWPAFYIQLPPRAFEFEVYDVRARRVDKRYAEGVAVAIDHAEPEYDGVRELAFMVMGENEGNGSQGRNCAFAGMRFGPDSTLDQFSFRDERYNPTPFATHGVGMETGVSYGDADYEGSHELRVEIPRVIIGLLLYLASEHPDIMPVPPIVRRTFPEIRSPIQRQRALANQATKLRNVTRLPVLVIGSRLDAEAQRVRAKLDVEATRTGKRWTLDRQVWVRGHYRQQAYGPGRLERRVVWIRPFLRGPDAAESMAIRAARVPRAQLNPEPR